MLSVNAGWRWHVPIARGYFLASDHKPKSVSNMKRSNLLYYATGSWLLLILLGVAYFVVRSIQPTDDVAFQPRTTIWPIYIDGIQPGDVETVLLEDVPVIVWRRDFEQKVRALEQLGVQFFGDEALLEEVRATSEVEMSSGETLQVEWFVISPINTGGWGCIVQSEAGDFGGFFDPCQRAHFDLWGSVRSSQTQSDLQVIPWTFSETADAIIVDTSQAPRTE